MARPPCMKCFGVCILLAAVEAIVAATVLIGMPAPADAQFFDFRLFSPSRPQRQQPQQRGLFDWFSPAPQQRTERSPQPQRAPERSNSSSSSSVSAGGDFSKAPAPKNSDPKADATVTTPVMVFGDAMADWLGYGLELAYADTPGIGILRRHRTSSGLIRSEGRDSRGEYPDWPQTVREMIAAQKPKFVLMMVGLNDRRSMRETAPVPPAPRSAKSGAPRIEDPAALEADKSPADTVEAAGNSQDASKPGGTKNLEFRSDAWSEAYIRRIDETIAALKTSGVPVFWVGLPPLRGPKSASEIPFLNDLYRSRADKAGIIYVDVWDGFVDEDGRFSQSGPDVDGQTRRLRTGDGVYFTEAGARKLAHYVEREMQRWLNAPRNEMVTVAVPDEPKAQGTATGAPPAGQPGLRERLLAGPVLPLVAERGLESDELLGGKARPQVTDAMVTKVLVMGETVRAPAGRADDFAWPRRGVAPVGSDPVVATTDLPMTPMVADRNGGASAAKSGAGTQVASVATAAAKPSPPRRTAPRPTAYAESVYRPDRRQQAFPQFSFQSLFGRW
jgi:hypothetical protein